MIRAGLVGAGRWGQTLVRSVVNRSDRIRFARGVTRTPEKARAFASEVGLRIDDDYKSLLADPDIDAVVIATPHSQHRDQIIQAAGAGKHVFVEKPLALDTASARAAYDAAGAAGVVLALGHNRRCLPAYARVAHLVQQGSLGRIVHAEGNFSGPSAFRQSPDNWRASIEESPAGGMTGKGIHITDLMISFLGAPEAVSVLSRRQVLDFGMDDTTLVTIRFASGQTGSLSTLTATQNDWRLQLYGSEGWVEIRDERTLHLRLADGTDMVETLPEMDIERAILERFADSVENRSPFPVTREQGIANTALLEAIIRSIHHADGAEVPVSAMP